jgi:hypothetical protein
VFEPVSKLTRTCGSQTEGSQPQVRVLEQALSSIVSDTTVLCETPPNFLENMGENLLKNK